MKLIKMLILSAFFALNLSALTEGVEYQTLAKPLNVPKNSVVKVFSYDCPHCYKFDRTITRKLMSQLDGVKFIPYHLSTKGKLLRIIYKTARFRQDKRATQGVSLPLRPT